MSATSELIAEQIRQLKVRIEEATSRGEDTSSLEREQAELSQRFVAATKALNEGRSVLKG